MPAPQDLIGIVVHGDDGIALRDGLLIDRELQTSIIVRQLDAGDQPLRVLPYQLGVSRLAILIVIDIRINVFPLMIEKSFQYVRAAGL